MSTIQQLAAALALCTASLPASARGDHPYETDAQREPALTTGGSCLVRGATVHTAVGPAFVGDVLVLEGRIAAVGESLEAPEGVQVIDGSGGHLAPGVVDCHSHMAIERGINEGTVSITAEVTMKDVVDPDDVSIYRALAGGVTTIRLLHGSANAIGGRDEVLKLRWHVTADELRFPGSEQGIKFALGENPKRSNWGRAGERYPASRMGVESIHYRAFERAREYREEWRRHEEARRRGLDPEPPRRDVRLDVLVGILEGDVKVHSHCYRADEILMLMRAMEHFGVRIATLQHVLEGYKVAHEMAEAGVGGSAFSDWWAYKIEAYDAIPQAAALMHDAGVLTSINSDSDEMVRRLFAEAAKSVRYAGMDRVAALRLVTLNPAIQLGIGERVGSIEVGKDADLAFLNGDPLSAFSRVEWTMVDGELEFTRVDAFGLDGAAWDPATIEEPARELPAEPTAAFEAARRIAGQVEEAVALVGGTVHPVSSPAIEEGTVLMRGGRIVAVGKDVEVPADARTIDCAGLHVWPGMISLGSSLGLYEIGAVAATVDTREMGGHQPDLRVSASVNADSAHFGISRHNGITRSQPVPRGSGLTGQSAVLRLVGETWEELLFVDRDMLHLDFPRAPRGRDGKPAEEPEELEELRRMFDEARTYGDLVEGAAAGGYRPPTFDPRLAALVPFVRGEKKVGVHVGDAQSILFALRFVDEQGLDAVLYDAREAWKVLDAVRESGLPVVLGPIWSLPRSEFDPYDAPFAQPAVLARAGVPFAISCPDTDNERNLPFQAATAVAHGLPAEEGVRAVTLYPARILGLDDQLGSLTPGKLADVVVTRGHLLEIDSPVEHVFIDGVRVEHTDDRHSQLHRRYRRRLEGLQR